MWDDKFEAVLREYLPFLPADGALAPDSDLRDLGLDSLAAVELLSAFERAYQVRFTDDLLNLSNFATAGTLWKTLGNAT